MARVIVAEDEQEIRTLVAEILEMGGHDVEATPNGRVALEASRRARPDVVLTDLMMPEMDGWALIHALRTDPALARVPVAAMSAHPAAAETCRALGVVHCLRKPFDLNDLLAVVEQLAGAA